MNGIVEQNAGLLRLEIGNARDAGHPRRHGAFQASDNGVKWSAHIGVADGDQVDVRVAVRQPFEQIDCLLPGRGDVIVWQSLGI